MTSPARIAANRQNAQKSTGPISPAGKARSAQNAVKHGLTSHPETPQHPGDPPSAFRQTLAEWIDDLKPVGIVQRTLAERACRAAWNLRRCDRYEDASAARRDRDAPEKHDLAETSRAAEIGRRLIAFTMNLDKHSHQPGPFRFEEDDPAPLVDELRMSAAGVAWLQERWAELGKALNAAGDWDEAREHVAVRLLGVRPEFAGDHPVARKILPEIYNIGGDWTGGLGFDHPEVRRVLDEAGWGESRPKTPHAESPASNTKADVAKVKALKAIVRSERAKLARLMARVLKSRADEDRLGAADRSMFDESRSLTLCLRYATAASRDLHRSLTDLAKLKETSETDDHEDQLSPPASSAAEFPNEPNVALDPVPIVDDLTPMKVAEPFPPGGWGPAAKRRSPRPVAEPKTGGFGPADLDPSHAMSDSAHPKNSQPPHIPSNPCEIPVCSKPSRRDKLDCLGIDRRHRVDGCISKSCSTGFAMRLAAVLLPELGTGPDEPIVVSHWYAGPGDAVYEGDRLVEVLVGPATFDVAAPVSGRLAEIRGQEDDRVGPGAVLGLVAVGEDEDGRFRPSHTNP